MVSLERVVNRVRNSITMVETDKALTVMGKHEFKPFRCLRFHCLPNRLFVTRMTIQETHSYLLVVFNAVFSFA